MTTLQLIGALSGGISAFILILFAVREEHKSHVIRRNIISDIRKRKKVYVYDEVTDSYNLQEDSLNGNQER